jgi:hypothetical protein
MKTREIHQRQCKGHGRNGFPKLAAAGLYILCGTAKESWMASCTGASTDFKDDVGCRSCKPQLPFSQHSPSDPSPALPESPTLNWLPTQATAKGSFLRLLLHTSLTIFLALCYKRTDMYGRGTGSSKRLMTNLSHSKNLYPLSRNEIVDIFSRASAQSSFPYLVLHSRI